MMASMVTEKILPLVVINMDAIAVADRKGQCSGGEDGYDISARKARKVFERAKRYHSLFRKGKRDEPEEYIYGRDRGSINIAGR